MRIRLQNELLLLDMVAILLIIVISFFPSSVWRIALGLPFALFCPGYTLVAVLFPRGSALESIERVALSFGLSIVAVPLIGLILNYSPWGIRLYPILVSVTIFIIATSVIAWYRRRRLPEGEAFTVSLNLRLPSWRGQSSVNKVLSIILIVVILGTIGTLGYVIATPKAGETFTEFYVLGSEGKAENYPGEALVGKEQTVTVGIINREREPVSYRLQVRIDGITNNELGPLVLGHNERWEEVVSFTPNLVGNNQKVELLLYKGDGSLPYLAPLHLWVNVKEQR
ncbi:DUF1616 domain-containing protein [Chloroflexota bacterium]